jgi:hypothetical protein
VHRIFCDGCGREIARGEPGAGLNRVQTHLNRITVELMVAVDNVWNGGNVCLECQKKCVSEGNIKLETVAAEPRAYRDE